VISGQYERGYEPQRRRVVYQEVPVVYENHRHYDDGRCRDARYEKTRRYEGKKHHGNGMSDKNRKRIMMITITKDGIMTMINDLFSIFCKKRGSCLVLFLYFIKLIAKSQAIS
jgi:hypothetical protein